MRTKLVGEGKEGLDASVICIEGHRTDSVGPLGQAYAFEQGPDRMRAHELGAVQQGKAFLGLEPDGLPSQFLPDFGRRPYLSLVQHFTEADQRQAQMCEGSKVTGSPERPLLVNDRQDVVVEHVDESLDRYQLGSGVAVSKALRLEEQHQFDDLRTHGLAGAAGMRHDKVVLELRQVFDGDGDIV